LADANLEWIRIVNEQSGNRPSPETLREYATEITVIGDLPRVAFDQSLLGLPSAMVQIWSFNGTWMPEKEIDIASDYQGSPAVYNLSFIDVTGDNQTELFFQYHPGVGSSGPTGYLWMYRGEWQEVASGPNLEIDFNKTGRLAGQDNLCIPNCFDSTAFEDYEFLWNGSSFVRRVL
jgi:hypothetical protein